MDSLRMRNTERGKVPQQGKVSGEIYFQVFRVQRRVRDSMLTMVSKTGGPVTCHRARQSMKILDHSSRGLNLSIWIQKRLTLNTTPRHQLCPVGTSRVRGLQYHKQCT